eukprot:2130876-Rhodomonas_salina.1
MTAHRTPSRAIHFEEQRTSFERSEVRVEGHSGWISARHKGREEGVGIGKPEVAAICQVDLASEHRLASGGALDQDLAAVAAALVLGGQEELGA